MKAILISALAACAMLATTPTTHAGNAANDTILFMAGYVNAGRETCSEAVAKELVLHSVVQLYVDENAKSDNGAGAYLAGYMKFHLRTDGLNAMETCAVASIMNRRLTEAANKSITGALK